MAQCRPNTKIKEPLRTRGTLSAAQEDVGCDACPEEPLPDSSLPCPDGEPQVDIVGQRAIGKRLTSTLNLRSTNKPKADSQPVPDVGSTGTSPTTHSNMKTKQVKEEPDKSIDEEIAVEPKTRQARKKASDIVEETKDKPVQDEPKPSKELKRNLKPKAIVKKRPLGIRKTLRGKKVVATTKTQLKNVIKQTAKRGRKPAVKVELSQTQDKDSPLIPASEIKTEPVDDASPNSRSSSPKTAGRRQRLSSDKIMMKSVLGDSPSSLVLGPRTSPYSMRSERSNSPSLAEGKNLRSGKPRKVRSNLLNEVVMKEQKKRRRLLSDSKSSEPIDGEDCKKLKRGRSCSRDGSEISKCSDITESDVSLSEPLNDSDTKELNKKLEKPKTELDLDFENNVQISLIEKVPSPNLDADSTDKHDSETICNINEKSKKNLSLKRSTSLDSDNNNSNRIKLEILNSSDVEGRKPRKTENDTLLEARSSILTSMSRTFNSKEVSKNIRKARRGRKAAAAARPSSGLAPAPAAAAAAAETDDKQETFETVIEDLISNLDQNIENDLDTGDAIAAPDSDQVQTKSVSKFYGLSKPLGDNNSIVAPETPVKDAPAAVDGTPSKNDDSENIRLHYEEDSLEKSGEAAKTEITYKNSAPASIDKLMDRLKVFEEFDKKRQRQECESKLTDSKSVMVTNDVVLINKSGANIQPLKEVQSVRSPERPIEKENVLSCFENNSAISIVKRDQVRRSIDIDLPNSVTLIKRNSVSARKESTSSNHSKESDAISIFEKSLGKDVTLTEIRKSVDKAAPAAAQVEYQFATLHPNNPSAALKGVMLDTSQISITPRLPVEPKSIEAQVGRRSRDSTSRKSSESGIDAEEKMATLERIKSPHQIKSPAVSVLPTPVAVKSLETQPVEAEALAPPLDIKAAPEVTPLASEVTKVDGSPAPETAKPDAAKVTPVAEKITKVVPENTENVPEKMETDDKSAAKETNIEDCKTKVKPEEDEGKNKATSETKTEVVESKLSETAELAKPGKSPGKGNKSARNSTESQPGPSNMLNETPESQKLKETVMQSLGLLTHKAAKEAKIEKQKEKNRIYGSNYNSMMSKKAKSGSGDYTGTLKTVIKLNRGAGDREKKKYRSSLKMTFQKSKHRSGKPAPEPGEGDAEDDAYYTIERREGSAAGSEGGHRKSHYSNRLNHGEPDAVPEPAEPKETLNLVIPEKASSFSIHPGRLCQDQCFYCGGKFGLFDTPCHIAQMKSGERQKKVLDNEERLTIDSCLCDACYRHVDRRANCPSYRKRAPKPPSDAQDAHNTAHTAHSPAVAGAGSEAAEAEAEAEAEGSAEESDSDAAPAGSGGRPARCHTAGCGARADRSIRRKWLIKMRPQVNKLLKLEGDYPGLHTIPLCAAHHRALSALLACALCRRRVTKHHNAHLLNQGPEEVNALLAGRGVPARLAARAVLCKLCRYYCALLPRPPHHDHAHRDDYTRRLLKIYNVEVPPELENEAREPAAEEAQPGKQKKKARNKSKQRKSSDPDKQSSESPERMDVSPEKDGKEDDKASPLEEDIESLISSNKIPVPGAKSSEPSLPSDGSDPDNAFDMETPLVIDKQTELQILLQKQNNPAQFMHNQVNLTQKQRNILKVHNLSGVQKPGLHQRINDKNARRLHKLGQMIVQKDKMARKDDLEIFDPDKSKDLGVKNMTLNDECTIESVPNKKPADITTLKNKWQQSESFTKVKKNLSDLSKTLTVEKEPKKSDAKYSNPVKRLETNPSISVRELFPGEEEMNLQCNIEFGNVKGVTPEGWEKCNTTIQYDVETKKLWHELQRPYGNQSSFLRHLILLEKYFRSGDLVLSHNATPHAANYSDSVQSRLRAYDNVVTDAPRRSEPAISLIEFRKKPSVNGKSLLKSNQTSEEKDSKKFMPPPPGVFPKPKPKSQKKNKPLPPELIAINTPNAQDRKAIQNVLHNIQQLVKGVSASDPTEVAAAPLPATPKFDPPKEKKDSPKPDTPKKQKTTSKPWRPTLMPITPENLARVAREPIQVAVDGRRLPSLVKVMSSGKQYHITLQDYNKMCVMRREKLQQLGQEDSKTKRPSTETEAVVTEVQTSAMLGNGGTVVEKITTESPEKKELSDLSKIGSNAATILKNVGLKNITIAPIPPKTATVTSATFPSPVVSSPSLLVTSNPIKLPQLGPAVSITSETVIAPNIPIITTPMVMPKIPKSLTVIPQTVVAVSQNVLAPTLLPSERP